MNWKQFLKPDWKKIILLILLIIFTEIYYSFFSSRYFMFIHGWINTIQESLMYFLSNIIAILGLYCISCSFVYFLENMFAKRLLIKDFLKPSRKKIVILIVIFILANIPYIGYFPFETSVQCLVGPCPQETYLPNPIFYPLLSFDYDVTVPISFIFYLLYQYGNPMYRIINISKLFLGIFIEILYFYFLSSVIVWIYYKRKKE